MNSNKQFHYAIFLIFILLTLVGCATVEPTPTPTLDTQPDQGFISGLQFLLDNQFYEANIPGGVLAIDTPEHGLITLASGLSNVESKRLFEPNDRFNITSVTKTFVATLIFQLIEEEKLNLEDTLDLYIPDFPYAEDLTIRQLLEHSTGLVNPDSLDNYLAFAIQDLAHVWTWRESADFAGAEPLMFSPGNGYNYSNANYSLLAGIIEAVTGNPYHQELRDRIFVPYNLNNTYVSYFEEIPGDYVHGYFRCTDVPLEIQSFLIDTYGDGAKCTKWGFNTTDFPRTSFETWQIGGTGIVSTTEDLVTWAKLLFNGEILNPESLEEMLMLEPGRHYALGIDSHMSQYGLAIGHSGGGPGETQMWYIPDEDITVVSWYLSGMDGDVIDEVLEYIIQN